MAQDLLQFGAAGGANVMSQAAYQALAQRLSGFNSGIARSDYLNKVWRQSAFAAAMLGTFTNGITGVDVLDDGNLSAFVTNFTNALKALVTANQGNFYVYAGNPNGNVAGTAGTVGGRPPDLCEDSTTGVLWVCMTTGNAAGAVWRAEVQSRYVLGAGSANAITASPNPAIAAYRDGQQFYIVAAAVNTGAVTLNVSARGAITVKNGWDGSDLVAGDIRVGSILQVVYVGGVFLLVNNLRGVTAPFGDSSLRLANTEFVQTAVNAALVAQLTRMFFYGQLS